MSVKLITAQRASTLIYGLAKGGDDGIWLIPANVCLAVPLAFHEAKVQFEFIDIDPITLCLDINLTIERLLDEKRSSVAGVIYVRTYGFSPTPKQDLSKLKLSMKQEAVLIDDHCLCEPVVDEQNLQSYGADVAIFSTGYSKVIDLGTGGYGVFFNNVNYVPPHIVPRPDAFDEIMQKYKAAMEQSYAVFANPKTVDTLPNWISGEDGILWVDFKAKNYSRTAKNKKTQRKN